jgi:hypothetical protein
MKYSDVVENFDKSDVTDARSGEEEWQLRLDSVSGPFRPVGKK